MFGNSAASGMEMLFRMAGIDIKHVVQLVEQLREHLKAIDERTARIEAALAEHGAIPRPADNPGRNLVPRDDARGNGTGAD